MHWIFPRGHSLFSNRLPYGAFSRSHRSVAWCSPTGVSSLVARWADYLTPLPSPCVFIFSIVSNVYCFCQSNLPRCCSRVAVVYNNSHYAYPRLLRQPAATLTPIAIAVARHTLTRQPFTCAKLITFCLHACLSLPSFKLPISALY